MDKIFYAPGLGYWSTDKQAFIEQPADNDEIVSVGISADDDKLEALKALLEYECYPTDKLISDGVRLEVLIGSNRDFLLNMFILTSLDVDIPDVARERFESLKNEISGFSATAKMNLLRS